MGVIRQIMVLVFLALLLGCGPAIADKRIALVIGNSAYKNVPTLKNPANDATLLAAMFKNAGFETVTIKLDLGISEMRKTLREFGMTARGADIAVIYYAGHGIEFEGNNYLIPIDATLETDADVLDETLSLDRVLFAVEPARKLRLIILDACRENPFARTMKRTIGVRAIGRGLAKVEPSGPNTLISFAAKAGSTASDGIKNSPFATALVEHLPEPGLDLRKAFGFVRDEVLESTSNEQEPYVFGTLGGDDVPLVPAKALGGAPQASSQDIRRDYELALHLGTREGWNTFLAQYPNGFYSNLAKGELSKIEAEEARAAAAEKARLAEEDKARLAAEGAKQAELAKAEAAARAAEDARLAAEKAKQREVEKAAAAEQARAASESVAAETKQQLAALSPSTTNSDHGDTDLPRALNAELRRLGCNTGAVDGNWNAASQNALDLFNKYAGMKLDVRTASADALDVLKSKTGRVCPLICDRGFRADGERCVRIVCRSGYALTDENTCEKTETKTVAKGKREAPTRTVDTPVTASTVARADAANRSGSYRPCMGALSGCYARAIRTMSPEIAQTWCSRRPTC